MRSAARPSATRTAASASIRSRATILAKVPLPNTSTLVNNLLVPDNARADKYDQHVLKVDQVMGQEPALLRPLPPATKRTEIK